MLQQERVDRQADQLRDSIDYANVREEFAHRMSKVDRFVRGDAPNGIGAGQAFGAVGHQLRSSLFLSAEDRQLTTAYLNSLTMMISDLVVKKRGSAFKVGNSYNMTGVLGYQVPMWQASGWMDLSSSFAEDIWTTYREENDAQMNVLFGNPNRGAWINEHSNPYLVHKAAWFVTMTTVEESLWRRHGYDPDMDSLGPYWMLAQVWNDPDPAKVRNALQAVRDMNLGTTFIKDQPEGSRVYIVDEFLLLDDYEVRSVNMRRKALGLEAVEVESYIADPLPNEVLPFAKDDVFYPAYLKMCEELGAEPYAPETTIDVRLDPETLSVVRV